MSYVRSIVESQPDLTSAALEIHCVIEGVDERARTRSESIVAEVMRLAGQVTNGGFDQYFFNSGVWSARTALQALHEVGAEDVAGIVQRAIDLVALPEPVPEDYEYDPPEEVTKVLNELDREFYAIDQGLYARVAQFALDRAEDFGFPMGT
jgi:uncharacterized protein DUF4375